jgi:hypothetical protein
MLPLKRLPEKLRGCKIATKSKSLRSQNPGPVANQMVELPLLLPQERSLILP